MGFFQPGQLEALKVAQAAVQAAQQPVEVPEMTPDAFARMYPHHLPAMLRGAECHRCPMRASGRGPVPGEIRQNALLTIIAESPGNLELVEGRPLIGPSGAEVEIALNMGGASRNQCSLTNIVQCAPPPKESLNDYLTRLGKHYRRIEKKIEAEQERAKKAAQPVPPMPPRPPTPIECCLPRLERDLMESNSRVTLAVGGWALRTLTEREGLHYGRRAHREAKAEKTPKAKAPKKPRKSPKTVGGRKRKKKS